MTIESIDDLRPLVERAVATHLPGRSVRSLADRGTWGRRILYATLDDGGQVVVKLMVRPDWIDATIHEPAVVALLAAHGLPAARVLAADTSRTLLPYPYVIQEYVGGAALGQLLAAADEREALAVYETLGALYRRLHAIHGARSGIWLADPEPIYDVAPGDYMYQANLVQGSGQQALAAGLVTRSTYERAVRLWAEHLPALNNHRPTLVHGSPFLWTIYLERGAAGWRVTKLGSLGDVLWWDPAYDLALLRFPPFGAARPERWAAFLRGYGPAPEEQRMLLYAVLQRFCAATGAYMEPQTPAHASWVAHALDDMDALLDAVERA